MALIYGVRERKEVYTQVKDGTWIFHYELGEGPPLLMLHSFGGSSWAFREIVPTLAQHFKCYVVDLPGYDRSSLPNRRYVIEDFTDDIVQLMDSIGLEKAHMVGQLTGAIIDVDMAGRYPEKIDKIAFISLPGWDPASGARVFWNWFVPRQPNGVSLPSPYQGTGPKEVWAYGERIRAQSGQWDAWGHEENTHWDVPANVPKINHPTLLIYGEHDTQRRRESLMLELIKGSKTVIIPGAPMGIINHDPDGVSREIINFLQES